MFILNQLFVPYTLFGIGLTGLLLNARNVITLLMSLELMLAGLSYSFLISAHLFGDIAGEVFSVFILTIAAAESAIALAMLVVYFKLSGTIEVDKMTLLRG